MNNDFIQSIYAAQQQQPELTPEQQQELFVRVAAQIQQQAPTPHIIVNDEPLYVNARQYHRILRRREARQRTQVQTESKGYTHESRHLHAKNRIRGPGGRFLSSQELASLRATNRIKDGVVLQRNPNDAASEHDQVLEKLNAEMLLAARSKLASVRQDDLSLVLGEGSGKYSTSRKQLENVVSTMNNARNGLNISVPSANSTLRGSESNVNTILNLPRSAPIQSEFQSSMIENGLDSAETMNTILATLPIIERSRSNALRANLSALTTSSSNSSNLPFINTARENELRSKASGSTIRSVFTATNSA